MDSTTAIRFTALLAEHRGAIRKVAMGYAGSAEDREDLTQEILAQLWRSFERYDAQRPFSTWLYRVALNVAITHLRRRQRSSSLVVHDATLAADPPDPRSTTTTEDPRLNVLQQLLAGLDELDRALLLLHLDDRSYREIAEVLGLSESNVGTKLNRLRERLRRLARKEMQR